jgi:hypothetical protein
MMWTVTRALGSRIKSQYVWCRRRVLLWVSRSLKEMRYSIKRWSESNNGVFLMTSTIRRPVTCLAAGNDPKGQRLPRARGVGV